VLEQWPKEFSSW